MSKRTIDVGKDDVRVGDIVTLSREYGSERRVTITGKVEEWWSGRGIRAGENRWLLDIDQFPDQFVSATREVEVPDLPTEEGSLIWAGTSWGGPARRILLDVFSSGIGPRWWGPRGHLAAESIRAWQPVTPETLDAPDPDAWIEVES